MTSICCFVEVAPGRGIANEALRHRYNLTYFLATSLSWHMTLARGTQFIVLGHVQTSIFCAAAAVAGSRYSLRIVFVVCHAALAACRLCVARVEHVLVGTTNLSAAYYLVASCLSVFRLSMIGFRSYPVYRGP